MTTKRKPQRVSTEEDKNSELKKSLARVLVTPASAASFLIERFSYFSKGQVDSMELFTMIKNQCTLVHQGNLEYVQSMLMGQADSLSAIYGHLALCAHVRLDVGNIDDAEAMLRLALLAQEQCRATLGLLVGRKG